MKSQLNYGHGDPSRHGRLLWTSLIDTPSLSLHLIPLMRKATRSESIRLLQREECPYTIPIPFSPPFTVCPETPPTLSSPHRSIAA
jgi:hypothetical protein